MFYIHILKYIEKRLKNNCQNVYNYSIISVQEIMGYFDFLLFAYLYFLPFLKSIVSEKNLTVLLGVG